MSRDLDSGNRTHRVGILFACLAMVTLAACASTQDAGDTPMPQSKPEPTNFDINSAAVVVNQRGSLQDPKILVVFDKVGVGGELCPIDTEIVVNGQRLSTAVPAATVAGGGGVGVLNNITWFAVDKDLQPFDGGTGFHYAAVFHPFNVIGVGNFVSRQRTYNNGTIVERIGPLDLMPSDLIPVDVQYKYTIVRIKKIVNPQPNGPKWTLVPECKPLDPVIRVF